MHFFTSATPIFVPCPPLVNLPDVSRRHSGELPLHPHQPCWVYTALQQSQAVQRRHLWRYLAGATVVESLR